MKNVFRNVLTKMCSRSKRNRFSVTHNNISNLRQTSDGQILIDIFEGLKKVARTQAYTFVAKSINQYIFCLFLPKNFRKFSMSKKLMKQSYYDTCDLGQDFLGLIEDIMDQYQSK